MKKISTLLLFILLSSFTTVFAQVNPIGSGISQLDDTNTNSSFTINNISIPDADSRLLVLVTVSTQDITSISLNLQGGQSIPISTIANSGVFNTVLRMNIYHLALQDGNNISGSININTNGNSNLGVFVRAFENVDLNNPIDANSNAFTASNSNQTVPTDVNDMLIDFRAANAALGLGALGQTDLAAPLLNDNLRSTFKLATSNSTELFNNQQAGHLITALNFGQAEIEVIGNGNSIANGDNTPATNDHTHFGNVVHIEGKITRTFSIKNIGFSTLSLTGGMPLVNISGTNADDFVITKAPKVDLAPNESTVFEITFDPKKIGPRTAMLSIANNDADENPFTFSIQGQGIAKPVPTMSQWGLLIFGLLLLNLSVFFIQKKAYILK